MWKTGSVEVWQCGSLDAWKCGSVEEWKSGSVDVWKSACEELDNNVTITNSVKFNFKSTSNVI